jgi:hypothetical protein
MDLSPSCKAYFMEPKIHYRVHKSHPLIPVLNQINPIDITLCYFSKIHFNITLLLSLGVRSGYFPCDIPIKIVYTFLLPHACYIPCLSNSPHLDHWNYVWQRVQVTKFLTVQFSPTLLALVYATITVKSEVFTHRFINAK